MVHVRLEWWLLYALVILILIVFGACFITCVVVCCWECKKKKIIKDKNRKQTEPDQALPTPIQTSYHIDMSTKPSFDENEDGMPGIMKANSVPFSLHSESHIRDQRERSVSRSIRRVRTQPSRGNEACAKTPSISPYKIRFSDNIARPSVELESIHVAPYSELKSQPHSVLSESKSPSQMNQFSQEDASSRVQSLVRNHYLQQMKNEQKAAQLQVTDNDKVEILLNNIHIEGVDDDDVMGLAVDKILSGNQSTTRQEEGEESSTFTLKSGCPADDGPDETAPHGPYRLPKRQTKGGWL